MERSFRWRRRSRLQFAGICAALALIGAFMVGPAYSSWTRNTADSAIKAYQSKSATAPRIDVGDSLTAFDPWGSILRASCDGWSMDDALRWKRFRDAVAEHHDGDTKDLKTLDEAIEARDPDGSLVTTDIRKRNRESIKGFLQLSVTQAELLPALTSRSHLRLQLSDAEYVRKVVRDLRVDPPSSINGNSWTTVATNLAELESWIGTGVESGRPAIVVADAAEELPKLRSEIARSRSAAMIRADLANAKLTNSLPEDLSTLRKILSRALAVDDPYTVERIDRMLSDRIVSEWNALVPVDMRQPPAVPDIANAIRKSDKFGWPYVEDAWRLLALKSLDTWRGGVPAWFADSKVEEPEQATFLANSSNQLKQCREVLFPGGTGRVDDLAPLDNALLLLSKRAKVLAGMKTEWQLAVVLPAIREAFADGTTANEPGIVAILPDVKFDFTRFADRQRAMLRAGLAERAMERTKAAITGTAAGAAQDSQSIVAVAAAVGGQDSIPNWVNQANSLCRSFEAA
ncbi:MAG: hypothetical protein EBR07_09755, partial [Planctomycetes bacterium]|nr:hypothetical protein [Planctomycetota bacterium]